MVRKTTIVKILLLVSGWLLINNWLPFKQAFSVSMLGKPRLSYSNLSQASSSKGLTKPKVAYKQLPESFEQQALIALAYYPDLADVSIRFVVEESSLAHTCQPDWLPLLWPSIKRSYTITISEELEDFLAATAFQKLSFDAQIGVLGHELAHIIDYEQRSNTQLIWMGICYLFESFRMQLERQTDMRAIERGLGFQLLAWSQTVHHLLSADGRGHLYLNPEQILQRIQENERYDGLDQRFFNSFD